jgi:hypothetical protein
MHLLKGYAEIVASHTVVVAALEILWYVPIGHDIQKMSEILDEVRNRGYRIDTSTTDKYHKSLIAAKNKVQNMVTRAEMKRKEIERVFGQKEKTKSYGYWEVIGNLELALERSVLDSPETLTLAKYNELKRGVTERRKAAERRNRTDKRG